MHSSVFESVVFIISVSVEVRRVKILARYRIFRLINALRSESLKMEPYGKKVMNKVYTYMLKTSINEDTFET